MVIFDENQTVSNISKYEFLNSLYVKIVNFLVIWHHFNYFYVKLWSENPSKSTLNVSLYVYKVDCFPTRLTFFLKNVTLHA